MPSQTQLSRIGAKALRILEKVPAFRGLSTSEYEVLVRHCRGLHFKAGEELVVEGERSGSLLALLSGEVEVSQAEQGVIRALYPGAMVGELGLLCNIKRTATVTALTDCLVLQIDSSSMDVLLGVAPRIYGVTMKNLATYLAECLLQRSD